MKLQITAFLILLTFSLNGLAQSDSTTAEKTYFEFSFGQSLLFIPDDKAAQILQSEAIVVPTSAILLFAEFRPLKKLRLPIYANLPTESKQFLVDSVLVNEKANTTVGFGIQYECFRVNISSKSRAEIEAGILSNMLVSRRNKFRLVPLIDARLRLVKEDNFVMYLGTSYSFGVNSWGLFYGTGFIF